MDPTQAEQPTGIGTVLEDERFTPRVKRLYGRLQESMLRAQETWRPAPLPMSPS